MRGSSLTMPDAASLDPIQVPREESLLGGFVSDIRTNGALRVEMPDIATSTRDYATRFAGPGGRYLLDIQRDGILHLLNDGHSLEGRTVLDVGGGHAQLAGPLTGLGCKVTVAGSDPSCAEQLRADPFADRIAFQSANLLDLPFADGQFDTVISIRLLAHMNSWEKLIAELCRVARHTVIVDYPTYRSLNALSAATFPVKKAIEKNTRAFHTFRNSVIRRAFARNGFDCTARNAQSVIPMGFHRLLGQFGAVRSIENGFRTAGVARLFGNPVLLRADRAQ